VIAKGSVTIEKDIAQKIALTYKNRVLSEVNFILDNFASYDARALEHWINVMEVALESLSLHKGRLSNVKISSQK
jgi:hypothetical protein